MNHRLPAVASSGARRTTGPVLDRTGDAEADRDRLPSVSSTAPLAVRIVPIAGIRLGQSVTA